MDGHARLVYGVAYRLVGRTHDAEDVAQETFREAFELAAAGRVTDWRGCLCRIATFRAIDLVRRRRKFGPLDDRRPSPLAESLILICQSLIHSESRTRTICSDGKLPTS